MSMSKRTLFAVIGVVAALAAALVLWRSAPEEYSGKTETIRFGTVPTAASTLIYIAEDQHFFEANRLTVHIKDYNTGIATTEGVLKGDLDIAWVAEFPFVHRTFAKEAISIIAVVGRFDEQVLFGRKDKGVHALADLKGKKIGLPRNTIAEFYLGRFLELNGMNVRDVTIVNVPPPRSMEAIASGAIDGVVAWEPYSSQLRARMADGATAFPIQSGQPGYGTIACRNDWLSAHPEIVNRFLRSLAQAEEYIVRNPAAAKAIVRKRLNFDDAFTDTIWSENQFSLSLDQSLITAMEDEARWMINNNITVEKQVPDFLKYIYENGLKSIKPEAVSIIR